MPPFIISIHLIHSPTHVSSQHPERSDRRGSGNPFPVPPGGCHEVTGGVKV